MAHWGLTAGQFFALVREALRKVDLSVVQTFSFIDKDDPKTQKLLAALPALTGNGSARKVASPTGVAHAHDLVHLLARAIKQAGTTRRASIRNALEQLGPYQGITRHFERPFTAQRHDALGIENVFMARFAHDGAIEPLNDVRQRGVEPVESVERKQ
jgi:branched-chain amino acid transport system substrate-binding protein